MHLLSQIMYSCKTLYMFRTVFPSITMSSKLCIRQQVYVKQTLLPAAIGDEMELHLIPDSSRCLTYTCCCIRSFELLMMDGRTVRNM